VEEVTDEKLSHINKIIDDYEAYRRNELNESVVIKTDMHQSLKNYQKGLYSLRKQNKDELENFYKERDNVRNQIHGVQEVEKNVTDIISFSHPDINYCCQVYKEAQTFGVNPRLTTKLFLYISCKKDEQIRNDLKKLTAKDKPAVLKLLEDIDFNKWKVSDEVIRKLNDLAK
jgi:hypothetical protein